MKELKEEKPKEVANLTNEPDLKRELFNIEAEQAILGTIIINNEYIHRVSEFLLPEHFYEPANKKIYSQILHVIDKINIIANSVTLKQFFGPRFSCFFICKFKFVKINKRTRSFFFYPLPHMYNTLNKSCSFIIS